MHKTISQETLPQCKLPYANIVLKHMCHRFLAPLSLELFTELHQLFEKWLQDMVQGCIFTLGSTLRIRTYTPKEYRDTYTADDSEFSKRDFISLIRDIMLNCNEIKINDTDICLLKVETIIKGTYPMSPRIDTYPPAFAVPIYEKHYVDYEQQQLLENAREREKTHNRDIIDQIAEILSTVDI